MEYAVFIPYIVVILCTTCCEGDVNAPLLSIKGGYT